MEHVVTDPNREYKICLSTDQLVGFLARRGINGKDIGMIIGLNEMTGTYQFGESEFSSVSEMVVAPRSGSNVAGLERTLALARDTLLSCQEVIEAELEGEDIDDLLDLIDEVVGYTNDLVGEPGGQEPG